MGKRFTETGKWTDSWFRRLSPIHKLAWIYVCDCCDAAGVMDLDPGLAEFQIGAPVDWGDFIAACGDRIVALPSGKLWLTKFIQFQYGKLSKDCKPHAPVLIAIKKHGLELEDINQNAEFRCGNVSPARRAEVFARDGNLCCYCGEVFQDHELEPDHVLPVSRGGTDSIGNLVCACRACNRVKWDQDPVDFINSLPNSPDVWKRVSQRVSDRLYQSLKEKEEETEEETETDSGKGDARGKPKLVTAAVVPVPNGFETPEVRHAIGEWLAYKAKRGERYRDAAYLGRKVAEFADAGPEAFVAAVNSSIGSNYAGLFPAKDSNGKRPSKPGPGQRYTGD